MTVAIDPLEAVTPRELEVIALYASGYDIAAIGQIKHLSPFTVRNYMHKARNRLEAKNLTHLCVLLVDSGLLRKNGGGYIPVQDERVVGE